MEHLVAICIGVLIGWGLVSMASAVWRYFFPKKHYYHVATFGKGPDNSDWHGSFDYASALKGKELVRELNEVARNTFPNNKNTIIVSIFDCGEVE
jgi:hypothetical protein